jgi:hypothetical protein
MAHYALIDEYNIVKNVITGKHEDELDEGVSSWEEFYGNIHNMLCKRTSYNTLLNQHKDGKEPFRYNYAGIGYTWDPNVAPDGAFIPPKPFSSWILNTETYSWEPPIPRPSVEGKEHIWLEAILDWYEIETGEVLPGPPV